MNQDVPRLPDGPDDQVNIDDALARFSDHWSPRRIATLNDYDVKLVKVLGEFTWHRHDDTDELFLVLEGRLTIQLRYRDVVLGPRELFVVPRGMGALPASRDGHLAPATGTPRGGQHRGRR